MRSAAGVWNVHVRLPLAAGAEFSLDISHGAWRDVPPDTPLQQRFDWPLSGPRQDMLLLCLESAESAEVAYVGIRRHRLRSLPGAWYLQVQKLGVGLPEWAVKATIAVVRKLAEQWWRVARVRIELCCLDNADQLPEFERYASSLGFDLVEPLEYEHTLLVPISGSQESVLRQFHRSIFKNARKLERAGHVIRPIDDVLYADRLSELYRETMARTGARAEPQDMDSVIRASAAQANRYRLLGLFRHGAENPESLLAFRWCGCAGRHAYDLLAASTRLVDEVGQIPMMPAIMLNVFDWARSLGASHFDFGGVVLEDERRESPVSGITRFKKLFGGEVKRVGSDLLLEPRAGWRYLHGVRVSIDRLAQK